MVHLASLICAGVLVFLAILSNWQPLPGETDEPGKSGQPISRYWYRFRGPGGAGISPYRQVPVQFGGPPGQGIVWKTPIALPGHSSPVIWEDRLFVSGADSNDCQVYCLAIDSGRLLWTGRLPIDPSQRPEVPAETGLAAPTMATDGRYAYAIFGTGQVVAFDMDGRLVWTRSLGVPDSPYGYASSLEAFDGLVIIQFDQGQPEEGKSRLLALDGRSGKTVWEKVRPVGASWTSPIIATVGPSVQLITVANPLVIAYEPRSGQELWRAAVVHGDLAPSPVAVADLVLAVEPYGKLVAVRATGAGDVTKTHLAWRNDTAGPEICSPLCDGKYIYLLDSSGLLTVIDIQGKLIYQQAVDLNFKASPSLADQEVLLISEEGVLVRLAAGPVYKELARYQLGEGCTASPAFAPGKMFIRTTGHVYCIATEQMQPVLQ
jgi:outer membrane protein assembly factor BamB